MKSYKISRIKGSGPGGQNRNKRESGIVIEHIPTGITVRSTERRSQKQNLSQAIERLEGKLKKHFHRAQPRKKSTLNRSHHESRLQRKKANASKKAMRKNQKDIE